MRRFARRRPILLAAIIVALIVVMIFGGRAAWRLAWRLAGPPPPPRQTDVLNIADWMSVPYVSRAYRVPNEELYRALSVEPEGRRASRLRDIAAETGITSEEAVGRVQDAVRRWQATHPAPGGPPGRSPDRPEREGPPDARDPPRPSLPPQNVRPGSP